MYNAKELQLQIGDVEMDYITFGRGPKPLIMIQGLNTNGIKGMASALAFMYRMFAKDYKVYLFDRRKNLPENVTVRELATDVALAMDTLGLKNADIFGVSQGGMMAQYLAVDRPDLVHRMVLAVTLSKNNEVVERVIADWIQMTEQGDFKTLVLDMAIKMYSDAYIKRYRPFLPLLTLVQKPKNVGRFLTLTRACLTCNVYEELDKITCPVLVLGSRKDKVVGKTACEEIAEKLGCESYLYDELGHAAYEEAKDFNQRIYEFLIKRI